MKLWDVLATCLLLLSSVASRPLYPNTLPAKRTFFPGGFSDSASLSAEDDDDEAPLQQREDQDLQEVSMEEQYDAAGPYPEQFDDVMDFIEATIGRLRRSSEPGGSSGGGGGGRRREQQRQRGGAGGVKGGDRRRGRGRSRGGGGGKGGRGERARERTSVAARGCLLKEVHLNVTDLGLGYQTKEELIFRYCSGPCAEAETNYDKILNNLTHNKKLDRDTPSRTCCRPVAFDDDLSFLDDNVVYHTLKKHSARKCGCV